ncbi:MAG: DUF6263 family protein [Ginsengibacter sp.]|jgi:hypothetical protein
MKKITLLFTAAICFSTAMSAQTNATLQLAKGQKYQVDNKMESSSSTEMQGQTMETKANIASTYSIVVNDKTGDNYNLTNTISRIVMNMSMMGNEINFDSDKKEDMSGQMGEGLKDYINHPQNVVMDQSGKIINQPGTTDSSASQIAKQLNFAASGYGAQMTFLALPKNVKPGTSWTEKTDDNGITRTTNYTIKDVSGNIATITFTGTVATDTKMEQQGMEIATKTSGKFSGEEKVNSKTGVIQSSNTVADASGTVSAMGQDFPTSSKVTSTTTVKTL